jgi:hypothetical protein
VVLSDRGGARSPDHLAIARPEIYDATKGASQTSTSHDGIVTRPVQCSHNSDRFVERTGPVALSHLGRLTSGHLTDDDIKWESAGATVRPLHEGIPRDRRRPGERRFE